MNPADRLSPEVAESNVAGDDTVLGAKAAEASQPFVGQWNQLVSNTNWEKGRIIHEWRDALIDSRAPSTDYSDEAWSRLVGGVTGQHVGRLRRVHQRFGKMRSDFDGLYWSHFQAALDWDDAEMWLEGAVRCKWSVSQMRRKRWETLGAVATDEPRDDEVISGELDEDFEPALNSAPGDQSDPEQESVTGEYSEIQGPGSEGPRPEDPDFGDADESDSATTARRNSDSPGGSGGTDGGSEPVEHVRPFEDLAELPDDLADAFDAFKLAILRHKTEGWKQISRDDLLASLEALKTLVLAPSAEESPF